MPFFNDTFEFLQLKKSIKPPEMPSKHVRNWVPKVLEQRRHGLELYLQVSQHTFTLTLHMKNVYTMGARVQSSTDGFQPGFPFYQAGNSSSKESGIQVNWFQLVGQKDWIWAPLV